MRGDRIPIARAQDLARAHGYDQVIIYARRVGEPGQEWVTTYGVDEAHGAAAARIGEAIGRQVAKPLEELAARAEKAEAAAAEARAEVTRVTSDRQYVIGWNDGFDHGHGPLRFPTMLRKMWSGGEVQRWLDEQRVEAAQEAATDEGDKLATAEARIAAYLQAFHPGSTEDTDGWRCDLDNMPFGEDFLAENRFGDWLTVRRFDPKKPGDYSSNAVINGRTGRWWYPLRWRPLPEPPSAVATCQDSLRVQAFAPAGFVLVPKEPTEAMLVAVTANLRGADHMPGSYDLTDADWAKRFYRAMLAAAGGKG